MHAYKRTHIEVFAAHVGWHVLQIAPNLRHLFSKPKEIMALKLVPDPNHERLHPQRRVHFRQRKSARGLFKVIAVAY